MRFTSIERIAHEHIKARDFMTTIMLLGSPGCGKSALGYSLATAFPWDNVVELNLSLLDVPDVAGLAYPDPETKVLQWHVSPSIDKLRKGFNLCILDEFGDATQIMQNLGRRLFWTREINGTRVSDQTFFICFSNRTIDKSGAGRLSGKVKNAVSQFTLESNLDDFVEWGMRTGKIGPKQIQFHRYRPALLDQYDPDKDASPTPRQWELVARVPDTLPSDLFFADVASKVSDGPAAEFTAFLKIYDNLISPEEVVLNPDSVPIPKDLSAQYAIVGSLTQFVSPGNVDRVERYVNRLTSDFGVMFWQDAIKKEPKLKATKSFIKWATNAGNVVLN